MSNVFWERRANHLSDDEKEAIEKLKALGWIAVADLEVVESTPEIGDGSPTYAFEGRHPIAIFKPSDVFHADIKAKAEADAEPEIKKKRGRPPKVDE